LAAQWFVRVGPLAKQAAAMVEAGKTRFVPESYGRTFLDGLSVLCDWCVSRQLASGQRVPAWRCRCGAAVAADEAPSTCAGCRSPSWEPDPDVLDPAFGVALWPFATLGWPDETRERSTFYPATVVECGHDEL